MLTKLNNKYGQKIGEWFANYRDKCGIQAQPRKKTFHSFRHTLTTFLGEQEIQEYIIAMYVGHRRKGQTTGRYMKAFKPLMLKEKVLDKIDFHKRLDLSHLKNSKYVIK